MYKKVYFCLFSNDVLIVKKKSNITTKTFQISTDFNALDFFLHCI